MLKSLLLMTALVIGGAAAHAEDAGCGLGSVIIQKNSKLLQLFAATTNHATSSQAFGITFGTSNCSASGIVKNDKQIEYFVEVNKEDLSREIAQGHGDKLNTLAALYGCATDSSFQAFSTESQKAYGQILPAANTPAVEMVKNLNASPAPASCRGT